MKSKCLSNGVNLIFVNYVFGKLNEVKKGLVSLLLKHEACFDILFDILVALQNFYFLTKIGSRKSYFLLPNNQDIFISR